MREGSQEPRSQSCYIAQTVTAIHNVDDFHWCVLLSSDYSLYKFLVLPSAVFSISLASSPVPSLGVSLTLKSLGIATSALLIAL
jgi:hypothetical protein